MNQAKRFKDFVKENDRLKKIAAELSIDNLMLKEAAEEKRWAPSVSVSVLIVLLPNLAVVASLALLLIVILIWLIEAAALP